MAFFGKLSKKIVEEGLELYWVHFFEFSGGGEGIQRVPEGVDVFHFFCEEFISLWNVDEMSFCSCRSMEQV
jgi:hypothetical protein